MKDNFSSGSDSYAKFRPGYPSDFFGYLNTIIPGKQNAWDCGTGNGQVAFKLAKTFQHVYATDISQSQIDHAIKADNITYSVQPAEKTDFRDNMFDLVIVAQAIHWFDFNKFYSEVRRTAKENALVCVLGYGGVRVSEQIGRVMSNFHKNIVGPYWDKERKYVDENYEKIPFPFKELQAPKFTNRLQWTLKHLVGYINTWSAVKRFIKQNGYNPVDKLQPELESHWGPDETKEVRFPVLLRIGQITK